MHIFFFSLSLSFFLFSLFFFFFILAIHNNTIGYFKIHTIT